MKAKRLAGVGLIALMVATVGRARTVYVVRVAAVSSLNGTPCSQARWTDNIVFYNAGAAPATIRLLEVSNGGLRTSPALSLTVGPGHAVNSAGKINWNPALQAPIWVNKLDIPDDVTVRSRVEAGSDGCFGIPPSLVADFGAFSLPIFDQLVPAGTRQVQLGADLGAQSASLNVGIYNDSTVPATAAVEVHQVCDDSVRETASFSIPAKTLIQFGGLGLSGTACPSPGSEFNSWMRYVTVTVDQPGFSYIVNRSTGIPSPPVVPYGSP